MEKFRVRLIIRRQGLDKFSRNGAELFFKKIAWIPAYKVAAGRDRSGGDITGITTGRPLS